MAASAAAMAAAAAAAVAAAAAAMCRSVSRTAGLGDKRACSAALQHRMWPPMADGRNAPTQRIRSSSGRRLRAPLSKAGQVRVVGREGGGCRGRCRDVGGGGAEGAAAAGAAQAGQARGGGRSAGGLGLLCGRGLGRGWPAREGGALGEGVLRRHGCRDCGGGGGGGDAIAAQRVVAAVRADRRRRLGLLHVRLLLRGGRSACNTATEGIQHVLQQRGVSPTKIARGSRATIHQTCTRQRGNSCWGRPGRWRGMGQAGTRFAHRGAATHRDCRKAKQQRMRL